MGSGSSKRSQHVEQKIQQSMHTPTSQNPPGNQHGVNHGNRAGHMQGQQKIETEQEHTRNVNRSEHDNSDNSVSGDAQNQISDDKVSHSTVEPPVSPDEDNTSVHDVDTVEVNSKCSDDDENDGNDSNDQSINSNNDCSDDDKIENKSSDSDGNESDSKSKQSDDISSPDVTPPDDIPSPDVAPPDPPRYGNISLQKGLLWGSLHMQYPSNAKIVRIFTSSTFTDTQAERNTLMRKIYPQLKAYCQSIGYEFQVVDMRWGVRDEATEDHLTSSLCMRELTECQRLSTGPNFITFLGQKYGYRPFPPNIPADQFEKMLSKVTDADDCLLLTEWFQKDNNELPATYWLTPIGQKLPSFSDNSNPEKQRKARNEWWTIFESMQVALRQAANASLSDKAERHKYYWSVTEEEIFNGVLEAKDAKQHCFWFKRVITDIKKNMSSKTARNFMDIGTGADEEAFNYLEQLKNEKMSKALPAENIKTYEVKWNEEGINPKASKEHSEYIERFSKDFHTTLRDMIDQGVEARQQQVKLSDLEIEISRHLQFAQTKCLNFQGRKNLLDTIKDKVVDSGLTVLVGNPGSGKTALMAKTLESLPFWCDSETHCAVVTRFVGTTGESGSIRQLLYSICSQIEEIYKCNYGIEVPKTYKKLMEGFPEYLSYATSDKPLYVVIDSLDQLSDADDGREMEWLPSVDDIPEYVSLILSTIPGNDHKVLPALQSEFPESCILNVHELENDDITEIIQESLKFRGRTLQSSQMEVLETACRGCSLPLYLKLALDESYRWKSYTVVNKTSLGNTVETSINFLLDRVEKYHGQILVSRALGYITASKVGLSEGELEDVLSCDDDVLNDVYQYHTPPLRRLPPLLWVRLRADLRDYLSDRGADNIQVVMWYHRQFVEVARKRYLSDEKIRYFYYFVCMQYELLSR